MGPYCNVLLVHCSLPSLQTSMLCSQAWDGENSRAQGDKVHGLKWEDKARGISEVMEEGRDELWVWGLCEEDRSSWRLGYVWTRGKLSWSSDVKKEGKNGMICKLEGSYQPPASSDGEWVKSGASHRAHSAGFRVMGPTAGWVSGAREPSLLHLQGHCPLTMTGGGPCLYLTLWVWRDSSF